MKLICESCHTRYSIADEKVRGKNKIFKIKCRNCGETMVVKGVEPDQAAASEDEAPEASPAEMGEDAPTTVAPAPSEAIAAAVPEDGWYVVLNGEQVGPVARDSLVEHLRSGVLDEGSFVWRQGYDDWKKLTDVDGYDALMMLVAPAGATVAPEPAAAPTATDYDSDATVVEDSLPDDVRAMFEAELAAREAAANQQPAPEEQEPEHKGGSVVAFPTKSRAEDELEMTRMVPQGSLEAASAERKEVRPSVAQEDDGVTTSAAAPASQKEPRPSAAARPAGKARTLDSFFGDEDEDDDRDEAPTPAAQASGGGFFGAADEPADAGPMLYQRRETSVLFSLSEFKKDKGKPADGPTLASPDSKTAESGLIDIRAVARKETKARQARQTAGDLFADFGGGAAPDSEAPLELNTRLDVGASAPLLQKKSSKMPMIMAIAAVVVIAGAVGAYFAFFRDQGTKPEASTAKAAGTETSGTEVAKVEKETPPAEVKKGPEATTEAKVEAPKQADPVVEKAAEPTAAGPDATQGEPQTADNGGEVVAEGAAAKEGEGTGEVKEEAEVDAAAAKKAAAEKAAAKKLAEAKKKEKEAKEAKEIKEVKEVKAPTPPKNDKPEKSPALAQNTTNSATDLLNNLQQARATPTPPVNNDDGGGANLPKKLGASEVRKVIRKYQGKVVGCYKTHGGGGTGAVTINTSITVGGGGDVRSARVTTGEFASNAVGNCIVSTLRSMSFPKFDADTQNINIPFRVQ